MCIPVAFQVRFTKTFKQYKFNLVSDNKNKIVVFSIVMWVSYTKSERFLFYL